MTQKLETVVLGGGCFWCTEAIFKMLKGILKVTPGYSGGSMDNPSYQDLLRGGTGHAEVIKIEFDPSIIPYTDLLDVFMHTHDPTTLNKQDHDVGPEYRSLIFYTTDRQKKETVELIKKLQKEEFKNPIVTEVKPLGRFFEAESYHKDYYEKNPYQPYCQVIVSPKLQKLREKYSEKLVKS